MKVLKTLISVVLCAVVLLAGFAAAKPESLKASAVISDQKKTVNPFSQTISWGGFDRTKTTTITYSNTTMITPSNTKFNGNDTYTFKVNENYSSTDRTCVITAKNGSTTKKYTVTQRGKIVTISPSYTGSTINGNGQELSFVITSNLRFEVHRFQQGSKIGYVGTFGSNTASGTPNSYTVKVSFPANTSGATKYGLGIWVQASNQVATKTYTQPVHTHVWGAKVVTTAATCTMPGSGYHTCTQCPVTENCPVYPSGHTYVANKTVAPTCTSSGYVRLSCTKCGDSFTTSTAKALGHDYETCCENKNVYVKCIRSSCGAKTVVCSYSEYLDVLGVKNPSPEYQEAYVKAVYMAAGGSSKDFAKYYNNLEKSLTQYDSTSYGAAKVFFESLYKTADNPLVSSLTTIGEMMDSSFCEKYNKAASAYQIVYSMHELLGTGKNASSKEVGEKMMEVFQKTFSLNPIIDATYGKIVGELYEAGVYICSRKVTETNVAGYVTKLSTNPYDDYGFMQMTVSELFDNYYLLPDGDNNATDYRRLFLRLKVAYEYHRAYYNYSGSFSQFIDSKEWLDYVQ